MIFVDAAQSDWPDGYRLATIIQFRFPECQRVELKSLIPQASDYGLELLEELLQWDPEKRPSAQQALKNMFFQVGKPASEPAHMPSSMSGKIQGQQQKVLGRNAGYQDDRVSHKSLDISERYLKDSAPQYRNYNQFNSLYEYSNNFNSSLMNSDQSTKLINDFSNNIEHSKWTKPENDYNSSFHGNSNKITSSVNNNYRPKMSADDMDDDDDDDDDISIDKEISERNPFASKRNTSDTGFHSTITTQDSQISELSPKNYSNKTSAVLHRADGSFDRAKSKELADAIKQRRNSQQNSLLNEKISDIYVNRNIGKLYENNVRGSIFDNKMYNGLDGEQITRQDYTQRANPFFLHENKSANYNENRESKIYNIFSKQRSIEPRKFDQSKESGEENGYLLAKMSSDARQRPKKSITILDEQQSLFEDEQLDELLG